MKRLLGLLLAGGLVGCPIEIRVACLGARDCQSDEACVAGVCTAARLPFGASCATDADCGPGSCDLSFPGGYCLSGCDGQGGCAPGGACAGARCLQACLASDDCRASYACQPASPSGAPLACLPAQSSPSGDGGGSTTGGAGSTSSGGTSGGSGTGGSSGGCGSAGDAQNFTSCTANCSCLSNYCRPNVLQAGGTCCQSDGILGVGDACVDGCDCQAGLGCTTSTYPACCAGPGGGASGAQCQSDCDCQSLDCDRSTAPPSCR